MEPHSGPPTGSLTGSPTESTVRQASAPASEGSASEGPHQAGGKAKRRPDLSRSGVLLDDGAADEIRTHDINLGKVALYH